MKTARRDYDLRMKFGREGAAARIAYDHARLESRMIIYTDGSVGPLNPGQGCWAFIVEETNFKQRGMGPAVTTNNRMEMTAVIRALEFGRAEKAEAITIVTDSSYIVGTMTLGWKRRKNRDLWAVIDQLVGSLTVAFELVKGHADCVLNNEVDELARYGA